MTVPRVLGIAAFLVLFYPSSAGEVAIDGSRSIIAVVTHKGGFAKGMAHNHLVAAAEFDARLRVDPGTPGEAEFVLSLATESLEVDRWDIQQAWYPRLETLEVLDEPFEELSEKKRAKIRKSMLGHEQLDSEDYPRIQARVVSITEQPSDVGSVSFPYSIQLALTVRGRTAQRVAAGRIETDGQHLTVEAVGTYRFTDFEIEPFSALLGAVKNRNEFHVYLYLRGTLAEEESDSDSR